MIISSSKGIGIQSVYQHYSYDFSADHPLLANALK